MSAECLPDHLKDKRHDDWPWPFSLVPRAWTSYCGKPPKKVAGNQALSTVVIDWVSYDYPKPIPPFGQWHRAEADMWFSFYFALTSKLGWTFRFGSRYDDVDHYYTFPSFKIGSVVEPVKVNRWL